MVVQPRINPEERLLTISHQTGDQSLEEGFRDAVSGHREFRPRSGTVSPFQPEPKSRNDNPITLRPGMPKPPRLNDH
jgi:hypothetical protein